MEYKNAVRFLVWLNFVFLLAFIMLWVIGDESNIIGCELPAIQNLFILWILLAIYLIFFVVGLIGVYRFKHYGRILLTLSVLIALITSLISGPSVSGAIIDTLDSIFEISYGALLALCWIPADAKNSFKR